MNAQRLIPSAGRFQRTTQQQCINLRARTPPPIVSSKALIDSFLFRGLRASEADNHHDCSDKPAPSCTGKLCHARDLNLSDPRSPRTMAVNRASGPCHSNHQLHFTQMPGLHRRTVCPAIQLADAMRYCSLRWWVGLHQKTLRFRSRLLRFGSLRSEGRNFTVNLYTYVRHPEEGFLGLKLLRSPYDSLLLSTCNGWAFRSQKPEIH